MFKEKQKVLMQGAGKTTPKTVDAKKSPFVAAAMQKSAQTLSENGAVKFSKTNNPFVTQFGVVGSYKTPRSFNDIEKDCEELWATNRLVCVIFIVYLRMITRVVTLFNGSSTKESQKGAEMRHEGIMRMIWLHVKAPDVFWRNIGLFVSAGSWKDIITMLQYDLIYNGWDKRVLDWKKFGELILSGLENKNTSELLKKYLPQIKARSKCTTIESQADTMIGKWICSLLFGNKESAASYKQYRLLKSKGTAHQWQQLISRQQFDRIDFAKIHGRALNLLVRSKFLANHGLKEKYEAWITSPETKDVKFTGFVHELFSKLPRSLSSLSKGEQETINKQFATLVAKGGAANQTELIVVRDTSGSMSSPATGTTMSCFNIAKAVALYFSEFLHGKFGNSFIEFNDKAMMHNWSGNSPIEKWYNDNCSYVGGTDFQSVIRLLCSVKAQGIDESEFPKGILCISDGEFNPAQLWQTNVTTALNCLRAAGFSEEYVSNFVIVLWNLQSNAYGSSTGKKFETYDTKVPNVFYFSGYSASVISFLTSKIKNAEELFNETMNQELLQMIEL